MKGILADCTQSGNVGILITTSMESAGFAVRQFLL